MPLQLTLGLIASALAIICFFPYLRDILKRKTTPHIYSWLVWTILQTVGAAAQLKDGAGYGAWSLAIGAIFCFTIFLLSFKYGTKNITRFDGVCLAASLVTIILYFFLDNPLWAIIAVAIVDFVGFLPTFRKGYEEPQSETPSTFVLSAAANLFSLGALQNYSPTTVLYVVSLLVTNGSFAGMIYVRRRVGVKKPATRHTK